MYSNTTTNDNKNMNINSSNNRKKCLSMEMAFCNNIILFGLTLQTWRGNTYFTELAGRVEYGNYD